MKVLGGDAKKCEMALIDIILKRFAYVDWTFETYRFPAEHKDELLKFASFREFDKAFPSEEEISTRRSRGLTVVEEDVAWMATRPPALLAVTDWLKSIHEGGADEHIKAAHKAAPTALSVTEYMVALQDLKALKANMDEKFKQTGP